ncbi:MAG: hypothetical protein O9322_06240 [Beijerinckiaceae bacterium]|nr:hypothetical protein [Beijerinckiaceae bacterium]MCZ8299122.1 hypothetical protein [Beijerinckiaceae bacterium]
MADIALSPGVSHPSAASRRSATAGPAQQLTLAAGNRIRPAIDSPIDVFQSSGLSSRARDLFSLLDSFIQASKVIGSAERGIESLTKLIESAETLARQALETPSATSRSTGDHATVLTGGAEPSAAASMNATRREFAARFDQLRGAIDQLAAESGHDGINLLNDGTLVVRFNGSNAAPITVAGVRFHAEGLGVNAAANDWQSDTDIHESLSGLTGALARLRNQSSTFRSDLSAVRARADFARDILQPIKAGPDPMLLSNHDEEAIRLVALTARQQLAYTALGLAKQAEGSVLRLF